MEAAQLGFLSQLYLICSATNPLMGLWTCNFHILAQFLFTRGQNQAHKNYKIKLGVNCYKLIGHMSLPWDIETIWTLDKPQRLKINCGKLKNTFKRKCCLVFDKRTMTCFNLVNFLIKNNILQTSSCVSIYARSTIKSSIHAPKCLFTYQMCNLIYIF